MIRVRASRIQLSTHAEHRLRQRADGLTRAELSRAVLGSLADGSYRWSERRGSYLVKVDGRFCAAVAFDEAPDAPFLVTVHQLSEIEVGA
jgi:hypothetical protein